jgi:hypothetical protein
LVELASEESVNLVQLQAVGFIGGGLGQLGEDPGGGGAPENAIGLIHGQEVIFFNA